MAPISLETILRQVYDGGVERETTFELCAVARSLVVNAQSLPDMFRALDIHAVTCPCVPPAPGARQLASEASA